MAMAMILPYMQPYLFIEEKNGSQISGKKKL
jgi:hypothetical protein